MEAKGMEGQRKWPWDKNAKGSCERERVPELLRLHYCPRRVWEFIKLRCCYLATAVRIRIFARAGAGAQVLQDSLLIEWLAGIPEPLTLPPQHLCHHLIPLSPLLSSHTAAGVGRTSRSLVERIRASGSSGSSRCVHTICC